MAFMVFCGAQAFARGILDVHSHPVFKDYRDTVERHGAAMAESFPIPGYDVENHLAFMDKAGIETSLLSMPAPNPYFDDRMESRKAARAFNIECFELKRKYPGRFKYCAVLPLPDVEGSIEEAIFALDNLDADCVKIATNSKGLYLGDKALDPLMEALDKRKAIIITHPVRPEPVNEELVHNTPLPVSEYLAETTRAILDLLSRNVLATYPNVKLIVPHCGAYLPMALPRAKALLPGMVKNNLMSPIDWEANMMGLYFDLAGTPSADAVRQLLKITDASHILYGSDYPYQPDQILVDNLEFLKNDLSREALLAHLLQDILFNNSRKLFGLNKVE